MCTNLKTTNLKTQLSDIKTVKIKYRKIQRMGQKENIPVTVVMDLFL